MPLKSTKSTNKKVVNKVISSNIKELLSDNKKSGKEKGANGKERPMKQIVAIAISKTKEKPKHEKKESPKKEKKEHKRKGYKD